MRRVLFVALAACSPAPPPLPPLPPIPLVTDVPAAPSRKPSSPAAVDPGVDVTALDKTADPCVDVYQFACGGWIAASAIPPDRARWSRTSDLEDHAQAALRDILDDAARGADPATRRLGDFYAARLDDVGADRAGLAALKPVLDKVLGVRDAASWQVAFGELEKLGVPVVWSIDVAPDAKDPATNAVYLEPVEAYPRTLDGYRAHVGRMLALAGVKVESAGADVIAIESELAKLAPEKREYAPGDAAALRGLGVAKAAKIVLPAPKWLAQVDAVRAKFTFAQWSRYFAYELLAALPLPKPFDDEQLELRKLVSGVEKQPERGKRCIAETARALGGELGALYAARHVSPASKLAAGQLVDALVKAAGDGRPRLAQLQRLIGAPDSPPASDLDVRRGDYLGNVLRARGAAVKRRLALAGAPVDRAAWPVDAFAVHAVYDPALNRLVVPAGMLQPPWFSPDRPIAANLGGLGVALARELVRAAELPQPACVAEQVATFEALPRQFLQSHRVAAEAAADLGGVELAYRAYRASGGADDAPFFVAVAQAACSRERPAETQRRLVTDSHAPALFRVYGSLRNMKEFAEAFRCAPGTPMRPAKTCSVW